MNERVALYTQSPETLGTEPFQIYRGLDQVSASQLIEKSRQPEILVSTPKDASERFKDFDALDNWLTQKRQIYTLLDKQRGDLGGIIWYGSKPFPEGKAGYQAAQHTFAIRLYEGYTGQGLALPFMRSTLSDYVTSVVQSGRAADFHGIWLSTHRRNKKAQTLYQRFGYEAIGSDNSDVFMVLSPEKIRETLGA
jgi:GNAT superfamily N-acetyltransferase